jgi:TrmH family RNA methyltransferase
VPVPIRIVLIDTTHPGNIGAVARAMKNMALDDLALVRPAGFPHAEATARASGASDVLMNARVCGTLQEAIADCGLIVGATARPRQQQWMVLEPRAAAARLWQESIRVPAAVLFGSERVGLSNEELEKCQWLVRIPANPAYESLNLAMAVQVLCYELNLARDREPPAIDARDVPLATATEMQRLYEHLEEVMTEVGFHDRTESGAHLMGRMRRLLNRAQPDQNEVNILRGLLTAIQGKRRRAGHP